MADKQPIPKNQPLIPIFIEAIQRQYGGEARWLDEVDVVEYFEGQMPWLGEVQVFELIGDEGNTLCYAWAKRLKDSEEMSVVAILHEGWVDSPAKAVRVSVVAERDQRQIQLETVEFNLEQLQQMGPEYPDYENVLQRLNEQRNKLRAELGLT